MTNRVRYASEWTPCGIGIAARRCMQGLLRAGVDVAWEPLANAAAGRVRTNESGDAPAWMRALRRREIDDEALVLHSVPFAWSEVSSQLRATHRIGHSVWELDTVPQRFIDCMNDVDEIWVPTRWNQAAYAEAFDKPVHVIGHAVALELPATPPIEVPADHQIVLLDSAWDWRKRPDRAVEAFLHAFSATDPVTLVIKTNEWDIAWPGSPIQVRQLIDRIIARFDNPANVIVDTRSYTTPQMLGLIQRSTCALSLTSSEGWGLGAFDAASLGVPVIITGYGGQVEFLGSDYPGLLPYRMVRSYHPDTSLFSPDAEWAYADIDSAVDLLRAVVAGDASSLLARSESLMPEIHERFGLDVIGTRAADLLGWVPTPLATRTAPAARSGMVVVLTPVKDAAHHAESYVDRILRLEHPRDQLSVAVLASDSVDGTVEAFDAAFERLREVGISASVFERDFGYRLPEGVPRWEPSVQLDRRRVLAKSRNHLLSRGLGDADWALWLDVDVIDFPSDVIGRMIEVDGDIVHPKCVRASDGEVFDLNAWTDRGRWHLDDYAGLGLVELHAVGGTMLLVRADCHRDGLVWPAYLHGVTNPRIRNDPEQVGRHEIGEIETEGLAIMADDMGLVCVGMPDLTIVHE